MRTGLIRLLAFVGGTAVLVYMVLQNVEHVGGWTAPRAGLPVVVGLLVWLCNIMLADALHAKRRTFVLLIGCVLLLAEGVNQLATTERIQETREDSAAPLVEAGRKREMALKRLAAAEKALAEAPTTSARLDAALADKQRADKDLSEKATARACIENCRLLLQHAVDKAADEVKEARTAFEQDHKRLRQEVAAAKEERDSLPVTRDASPAQKPIMLGLTYEQVVSSLTSLLLNVAVSVLLAFAIHPTKRAAKVDTRPNDIPPPVPTVEHDRHPKSIAEPKPVRLIAAQKRTPKRASADAHALRFTEECLRHRPGTDASFPSIHIAYKAWCERAGEDAYSLQEIVPAIQSVLMSLGVRGVLIEDVPHARDVVLIGLVSREVA